MELDRDAFDALVEQALDEIPGEIADLVHNVVVLVEDDPPADDPGLLGVYDGVSLTERGADHTGLPDRITVFRRPLLDLCEDADELVREVRITVVHEIAHHFGIDDDRLHELGYG
jgi:predicted Zn-dependent protease with MMP-like domain